MWRHIDSRRVLARSCNQIAVCISVVVEGIEALLDGGIGHGIVQRVVAFADFGVEVLLESDGELQDGSCFELDLRFGIEYEGVHVGLGRNLELLVLQPGEEHHRAGERRRHARKRS